MSIKCRALEELELMHEAAMAAGVLHIEHDDSYVTVDYGSARYSMGGSYAYYTTTSDFERWVVDTYLPTLTPDHIQDMMDDFSARSWYDIAATLEAHVTDMEVTEDDSY